MLKGLASDLTGSADICRPVRQLESCLANTFLLPNERILFALQSNKEEYTFTNEALLRIEGESATTTRKLVERFDYKSHIVARVQFETAGRVDRDCELKFDIGATEHMSIDVARDEEPTVREYYKVLLLLARAQTHNERAWEFARVALDKAAEALRLNETSGQTLTTQADDALAWIQQLYNRTHPRCYRDVIESALSDVKLAQKTV